MHDGFTGLTNDILEELGKGNGRFLVGGLFHAAHTGFFGDAVYGWWLINNGTVNFGYTGTYEWYGVTYKDDTPMVREALTKLIEQGLYKW